MPTRVFLDQKHKSARVAIRNVSKEEKTFKIKPIFYRMFENGRLEAIEKATPEERSAKDLIRYSLKKPLLNLDKSKWYASWPEEKRYGSRRVPNSFTLFRGQ